MKKIALLNTTILTTDGNYDCKTVSLEEAKKICNDGEMLSAIGHESTAQIMTELLKIEIKVNRILFSQEVGQIAVVFKLKGRPPEGKILSIEEIEKIGYEFKVLTRNS